MDFINNIIDAREYRAAKRREAEYESLAGFDPDTMVADIETLGTRIEIAKLKNARLARAGNFPEYTYKY